MNTSLDLDPSLSLTLYLSLTLSVSLVCRFSTMQHLLLNLFYTSLIFASFVSLLYEAISDIMLQCELAFKIMQSCRVRRMPTMLLCRYFISWPDTNINAIGWYVLFIQRTRFAHLWSFTMILNSCSKLLLFLSEEAWQISMILIRLSNFLYVK